MSSNDITLEATQILSQYPVKKFRKDMSSQEYTEYKYDWIIFEKIWIYDYTIKTLNKNASVYGPGTLQPYAYISQDENTSYTRGLYAHVAAYPSSSILFTEIPINLSTFTSLSTLRGLEILANASTLAGISTATANLAVFTLNLSTLGFLSTIDAISSLNQEQTSTLSSIISPADRSTFYFLDGGTYLSTVLYNVSTNLFPSVIRPVGISTVASFVSSFVLTLDTPSTFCSYLASSIVSTNKANFSTLRSLSSLLYFNKEYSFFPPPNISTYSSLSTLASLNTTYSFFSPAQKSTLFSLSNTFLYPPARLSTYVSLSTLAYLSTLYPTLPSTSISTLNSFSTIANLSTLYSTLSETNLSTFFFISTRLALYNYMSTVSQQLSHGQASTFFTLSSYSGIYP
jgi:hypothetical protein